jgi:para-aminobenzoate synthetase/4-amino-4-deoxychorismate lyase
VTLVPVCVPGGLGEHKWADRRPLARWQRPALGLIVDSDGAVLEASTANVWLVEGDRLVTPPADGRILPGVTRERLLEARPDAVQDELDLARLERADAVFLTSSIARLSPVRGRIPEAVSAAFAPSPTAARPAGRGWSAARGR